MKTTVKILTAISALALGLSTTTAQAGGPTAHQTYTRVKSAQDAAALKVGTKIAVTCPSCGAVTTSTVDKAKSHMHGVTCGACQTTFEVLPIAAGKASVTKLLCKDGKTGKKMPLNVCAEMH